jgi:hypothetical protein
MSTAMVQTLIAVVLVLGAVAYLGRRFWRQMASARGKGDAGCASGGCGCGPAPTANSWKE